MIDAQQVGRVPWYSSQAYVALDRFFALGADVWVRVRAPCRRTENVMHSKASQGRTQMRLRWVWTVPFLTLTAASRAQNLPMPGRPSDSFAAARVFDYASS